MQEITLSQYCAEIEHLLQDEAYDEAIAHCLHILKRYPKYYKAYRLLGQAYLEKGQNDAAMDLFARSLSADPEDFLPRIGLSVIYERQGKIAEAAWQMERAYEILPYNEFIREELAKLCARRDGMPLEFLPLTRGALARLYARGHLYAAAIAEIESLLQEAPRRYDLQALYLEVLWRDGRRLEAARAAQGLLHDLPYCLKANLILGEFWMASGREADARELFRRAAAVDPELLLAPDLLGPAASVQPATVHIERLMYVPPIPAYARPATEEGEIPDWLQALGLPLGEVIPSTETAAPAVQAESPPETPGVSVPLKTSEEAPTAPIPEPLAWLRSVEVSVPSEGAGEEEAPVYEETPEWLRAVEASAAVEPEEGTPSAPEAASPEIEWPEWLKEDFVLPSEPPPWTLEESPLTSEVRAEWEAAGLPGEMPLESLPEISEWEAAQSSGLPLPEIPPSIEFQMEPPAEESTEPPASKVAKPPPLPESLSPDEALAWLARIAAGKEEELRAQAEREAEARLAEILGRRPTETPSSPPAPAAPKAPEAPPAPPIPQEMAAPEVEVPEAVEAEEEASLPEWLLALKPSEEAAEAPSAEEERFRALLEEAASQPLEIPSEWATELGLLPKETAVETPAWTEAPAAEPVPGMPATSAIEAPAEKIPLEMVSEGQIAHVPIWDLIAADEGVPPAGKVPEPLPPVDLRWLEGLHAVPIAEAMAGPLLGVLAEYDARLKAQPRDHETRLAMARLLFNLGDTARAVREYQRLLRVAAMRDTVIADLEQAVQLRPNEPRLWQALGDAYQEAGRFERALEAYRRALATLGT